MPIFEYECRGCSERFEALVYGDETPTCPACEGADLEKLFSSFAVSAGQSEPGCSAATGPGGT